MADEPKFTQADIDAAIEKAVGPLKSKLDEVMDEAKEAKRKLRAASEIKPEDLAAAEDRAEKAETKAKELEKQVGTLTKERDTAVQSLESESKAARTYALEAEINGAIASGNVVPALAPHFKASLLTQAQAELVDGKYVVKIGDKSAAEHIKAYLESDDGKVLRAAAANGGGGAPGGSSAAGGGKTIGRDDFAAMPPRDQSTFIKEGGKVVDQAA